MEKVIFELKKQRYEILLKLLDMKSQNLTCEEKFRLRDFAYKVAAQLKEIDETISILQKEVQ